MDKPLRRTRANWTEIVLVCRKCSRKLDGGFGKKGKSRLSRALHETLNGDVKPRKARVGVIEVGCFGICPKNAVTTVRAGIPGQWFLVPKGMAGTAVVAQLGLDDRDNETSNQQPR